MYVTKFEQVCKFQKCELKCHLSTKCDITVSRKFKILKIAFRNNLINLSHTPLNQFLMGHRWLLQHRKNPISEQNTDRYLVKILIQTNLIIIYIKKKELNSITFNFLPILLIQNVLILDDFVCQSALAYAYLLVQL